MSRPAPTASRRSRALYMTFMEGQGHDAQGFDHSDLMHPAYAEISARAAALPSLLMDAARDLLSREPLSRALELLVPALPTGLLDNEPVHQQLQRLFDQPNRTNDFRQLKARLTLAAIDGEHCVAGALTKTVHATTVALNKGVDLLLYLNLLVPFDATTRGRRMHPRQNMAGLVFQQTLHWLRRRRATLRPQLARHGIQLRDDVLDGSQHRLMAPATGGSRLGKALARLQHALRQRREAQV